MSVWRRPPRSAAWPGVALAALALAASATATQPPCEARVRVKPKRVYVGEQVLYGLEIDRSAEVRSIHWARPLSAPGFRMESLPTRTDLPAADPSQRTRAIEERRALFPTRAGELEIPPARLRCMLTSEGAERELDVDVPPARVRVLPLPEVGRPPGFSGVVGQLEVSSRVEPAEIELGGSASLTVLVEGRANLWELRAPFDPDRSPIPNADLLARPSEIARDAGRELRLRRYFFYDLVPRSEGAVEVPSVAVSYFDPRSARFVMATTPVLRIEVHPPRGPTDERRAPAPPAASHAQDTAARDPGIVPIVAWIAGGSAALVLWLWIRSRRGREPLRVLQDLLDRAAAERAEGELVRSNALLARALRTALEGRLPGTRSLSAEELQTKAAGDPDLLHAATLLCQLDRARFSGALDQAPDPETTRRAALRISSDRG